jgi:TatA/E family protein of Tat protein translocase
MTLFSLSVSFNSFSKGERMGEFSLVHWLAILIILVLFFGPSRLPQLGSSLGKALRGFKEGLTEKEKEAPGVTMTDVNARIETSTPKTSPMPDMQANRTTETTRQPEMNP